MTLVLSPELGIGNIATLREELLGVLQVGDCIDIDVSQVCAADTAAIQLLAAFMNRVKSSEKTVRWHGTSDVLLASARLSGFTDHLALNSDSDKGS